PGERLIPLRSEDGDAPPERRPAMMAVGIATLCAIAIVAMKDPEASPLRVVSGDSKAALGAYLSLTLAVAGLIAIASELPRALFSWRNLIRGGVFIAFVGALALWRKSYYGGSCAGGLV